MRYANPDFAKNNTCQKSYHHAWSCLSFISLFLTLHYIQLLVKMFVGSCSFTLPSNISLSLNLLNSFRWTWRKLKLKEYKQTQTTDTKNWVQLQAGACMTWTTAAARQGQFLIAAASGSSPFSMNLLLFLVYRWIIECVVSLLFKKKKTHQTCVL